MWDLDDNRAGRPAGKTEAFIETVTLSLSSHMKNHPLRGGCRGDAASGSLQAVDSGVFWPDWIDCFVRSHIEGGGQSQDS